MDSVEMKIEVFVAIQDSLRHHYVWEGWGTSLCWWANFAGGLPKQDMDSVLDLLFDHAKGLGLNIVRYNIGGGANPAVDTNMRPFADIPGFRPGGPSAPYDWAADERQRKILLGAMERGVTVTEAFSNSPPFWMTISGSVTGNIGWGKDNLDPNYYDAFVDYLTTIVKHFEEAWGIHFDTINPFNEPVEGWWNIDRRRKAQEGCNFSIPTISKVLLSLQKSLDEKKISTKISAFDSWSQNTCQVLLRMEEDCLKAINQVNVHTYVNVPTKEEGAQRQKVKQRVSLLGKKLWMSEYGPLSWVGEELDIALAVGRHITLDLNDLQPSAWCYWQALEVSGSSWGLLTAPFSYEQKPFVVSLSKQYFVMMHFTRWIRPGFQIFDNASLKDTLVIASNLSGSSLVLVGTNTSNYNKDIRVDLSDLASGLAGTSVQAALFRTSAVENHVELPILYFDSPIVFVRLALKSITSIIIS
ncbi:hypothetical protein O6H91_21G061600 [Diphasiastrum complanatum]|uniref:Uncharacterized protein n=1 Tax=Diphasiastrum complanatum TaxID=34168 RepID=A0ACC2AL07_DIPCM|nr:hypothetical protein O6H91_21G061600 [Diphasiastrum complanatum]